ncbi:MAG: HAD family hydrolase [Candidatus Limnocylindrales bacterium]
MNLDAIDLVIFDKDGTLIDFHAMWSGWSRDPRGRAGGERRPADPRPAVRDDGLRPGRYGGHSSGAG